MTLVFFSQLVGKPVLDKNNEKVAILKDLIVRINTQVGKSEEKYPPVAGLLAQASGRTFWIPVSQVKSFSEKALTLYSAQLSLERFERRDGEILLGKDVLDKQLVDVEGRRVIRVNDMALGLVPQGEGPRLVAVDISFQAILRRLLPGGGTNATRQISRGEELLDWADVQYFASSAPAVRLNVSHERLAKLHPVDIARLLDELTYVQRSEIVNALDDEVAADTLEEMESDDAADILEGLNEDRAADILEEMQPDDAADLLGDLDEAKANTLLSLMESEESSEIRELMAYDEDTAGGIMTNDFLILPLNLTAAQALQAIRALEEQPEFVDYIYVVEPGTEKLVGVAALRDVVFCRLRNTPLSDLIVRNFVGVEAQTPAKQAAAILANYGYRALPVLQGEREVQGIITFDDAMDILLPEDLRKRVPLIFKYHRGLVSSGMPR